MLSEMMDIKCQRIGFVEANKQAPVVWATINESRGREWKNYPCGKRQRGSIVIRHTRYVVAYPYLSFWTRTPYHIVTLKNPVSHGPFSSSRFIFFLYRACCILIRGYYYSSVLLNNRDRLLLPCSNTHCTYENNNIKIIYNIIMEKTLIFLSYCTYNKDHLKKNKIK